MSGGESQEWTKAAVLEQLERAGAAEPGLQAFLDRDVQAADVESVARAIIGAAGGRIGPISKLGKSFAVRGDLTALRRIADDPRVTAILPPKIDDILPTPITGKP